MSHTSPRYIPTVKTRCGADVHDPSPEVGQSSQHHAAKARQPNFTPAPLIRPAHWRTSSIFSPRVVFFKFAHHQDPHLLLGEEALEELGEGKPHFDKLYTCVGVYYALLKYEQWSSSDAGQTSRSSRQEKRPAKMKNKKNEARSSRLLVSLFFRG